MKLIDEAVAGSKRSLAKIISQVESRSPESQEILKEIYRKSGNEFSLGITGPPGAGKSTLIGALAERLLDKGYRLGIIAIDPTSPFSGGAFLGDRVRFMGLTGRDGIYVRSMASRGHRGGINRGLINVIRILGAAGYDFVIVETVGTGQNEVDIGMVADMTILVMVPDGGDEIQLLKSGSTEIADVFLVNKADHEGADILISRLLELQQMKRSKIRVFKTVATEGEGIEELGHFLITQHRSFKKDAQWVSRRSERMRWEIAHLIEQEMSDGAKRILNEHERFLDLVVEQILSRKSDPYSIAEEFSKAFLSYFENQLPSFCRKLESMTTS
jgi:LAO/AO transport system kinase